MNRKNSSMLFMVIVWMFLAILMALDVYDRVTKLKDTLERTKTETKLHMETTDGDFEISSP